MGAFSNRSRTGRPSRRSPGSPAGWGFLSAQSRRSAAQRQPERPPGLGAGPSAGGNAHPGTPFSPLGSYGKLRKDRCPVGGSGRGHQKRPWSCSGHFEMVNHPRGHPNAAESPIFSDESGVVRRPVDPTLRAPRNPRKAPRGLEGPDPAPPVPGFLRPRLLGVNRRGVRTPIGVPSA